MGKIYNSFDVVGDIAIIRLPDASQSNAQTAATAIMSRHRNVKTVLLQASPVSGDLRLRRLTHVAGENKTSTVHREFGCSFSVDVAKCYFLLGFPMKECALQGRLNLTKLLSTCSGV